MNVTVTCNGTTLDPYLISYTREDNICNSTSIATLALSINCPVVFDFYDTIVITEDGVKKGTYALITKEKSVPQGVISISCSNSQKSLENHFIEEKYDIQDTPTLKTRYWIEKFMIEAGVTYTITAAGAGEYLPSDLVLGGVMAIDVIKQLLQYSGWYMRYDENGVAIVGILDYDSNYYSAEIEDTDIVDFKIEENDAMLRNRVVVWGMGSTFIENNGWTFVDLSVTTPWNYDDNDKRTILISNSMISDITLANTIAKKTLDEFTKPNIVKTVKVKGFVDVMVGDRIFVNSKYYNKICTVTTVYVGLEQGGTHTTLTLDERCPRLIGYFNYGGYVYVGTDGDGIWRKPLKYSDDWEDYSTGITDLHITDLSIAGGVMSCVTESHYLYVRYPSDTQWNRVSSFTLYDEIDKVTYATINGEIVACSVDRNSGVIYAGIHYQLSDSGFRSWVGKITSPTNIVTTNIVTNSGNNYYLSDLDSNNYAVYIDAYTPVTTSGVGGHAEQEELGGLHVTNSISDALSDATTGLVSGHYAYNTDWQVNSITTIPEENNVLLPVVGTRIAVGKYVYWLDSDGTHVIKYNYKDDINYTVATSVSGSRYARYLHVYNENITIGTDHAFLEADSKYTFEFEVNDFSTNSSTRYILDYFDISFCQRQYVQNTRGSVMIQNKLIMFYTIKGGLYYKVYNPENNTLSDRYSVFIPATYYDEYLTLEIRCVLGTKVYGDLLYWGDDWEPAGNPHQLTFCVDIGGANVVLTDDDLTPQIADYSNGYVIGTKLGKFIRINDDLTISDIADFPVGGTDICFVGSKNKVYYLNSFGGNARIYEIGAASCTLLVSGVDYANIARNADDVDDGILILNNSDDLIKYTFPGGVSTTEQVFSSITPEHTNFIFLFGERISVGRYLLWSNASDGPSATYLVNVLLEHKTTDFYIVASVSANLVDASQDYPVAVYGGDPIFNSGSLEVYKPPNTFNYVNLITYSSGGIGSTAYVYDIRSFSQLVPGSGYLRRSVFTRNTVVDGKTYLQLVDYDLITIPDYIGYTIDGSWVPFSGTAKHVEVSNYGDNPYFFVSIAGSPSKFYQKDRYDNNEIPTTYEDNSYGLPSSEVTIIRLDDLI